MRENMLRILHVTESHAEADGGVTTVVNDLTHHISSYGVYSCVLAAADVDEFVPKGVEFVKLGKSCNSISALFSSALKSSVREIISLKRINVIHIHGVWMPLQIVACRLANELGIPFIVTSHGMLEPWLWIGKGLKGYIKKKLYFKLIAYPVYNHANKIHSITSNEYLNLKKFFPNNQHIVIPNAIDVGLEPESSMNKQEKILFFIGRINPKKGVDLLIESFIKSKLSESWKLVIAGPDEVADFSDVLRQIVKENNMESKVTFVGSVYGEEKRSWYRRAWITIVPSYSEVIGMVNLEAASMGCPTITTVTTGLNDWESGGGVLIRPDVLELESAIREVSGWSSDERVSRGKASYDLVKNKYSWVVVGKTWYQLYEELLMENRKNGS